VSNKTTQNDADQTVQRITKMKFKKNTRVSLYNEPIWASCGLHANTYSG